MITCMTNNKVKCSLCDMVFDITDSLYEHRIKIHTIFHSKSRIQKRNTTNGIPEYI